jgi:hypothetical protein
MGEQQALTNEILFARLLGPSGGGDDDSSDESWEGTQAGERTAPVVAQLISRGLLDDDHMSAAQIEGLIRRQLLQRQVALERERQERYEREASGFLVDDTVLSDCNLSNFIALARRVDPLRAMTWIRHCPVTDHRMETPAIAASLGVPVQHITPQVVLANSTMVPMTVVACRQAVCHRCERGIGGYRFQWLGPWSCEAAHGNTVLEGRQAWMRCMNAAGCPACRRCQTPLPSDGGAEV